MADDPHADPAPAPPAVSVHEAEPASGPGGWVEYGAPLTDVEAVARLQAGLDIVARGAARAANRHKAEQLIVAAFGGSVEDMAHRGRDSKNALPHFHPPGRFPNAHSFFEETYKVARKRRS